MKRLAMFVVLPALAVLSSRASAQACPFNVQSTNYGSACSPSGTLPSGLAGLYANGPSGCSVTLTVSPSPDTASTYFITSLLVLGFQSITFTLPSGCTLLAFPTLLLPLPFTNAITIPLPPDPALAGLTAYAQGLVIRTDIFGTTEYHDLTPGLQVSIL